MGVTPLYPQYIEKLYKVMGDIDDCKNKGYIIDFSLDDGKIKLLDVPTEKELQNNFVFKKYSDARDIYKQLVKEIRSVT